MANLPAFCDNCGLIFNSGIAFENCTNVSISGIKSVCPNCGSMAYVPEGLFNFIDNSIVLLKGSDISIKKLIEFKRIITELREKKLSLVEIKTKIEKDAPELNSIISTLPKTRTELYAFLALLLTVITLMINQCEKNEIRNVTSNNIVNNYNVTYTLKPKESQLDSIKQTIFTYDSLDDKQFKNKKIGRNEKCPCGSGKKFKYCHGKK